MKTVSPYDWVKHVDPELLQHDAIPLTGGAPPFPWEEFAVRLAKSFELKTMTIESDEVQWRSAEGLLEGIGEPVIPVHIAIPSIEGGLYWLMPEQEIVLLMSLLLTKESHPFDFQDPELIQGFYRFILLESIFQITQVEFDKSLAPCLTTKTQLQASDALCLDVSLVVHEQKFWGRLVIAPEFRRSWLKRHARSAPTKREEEIAKQAEVILHLEAGRTLLNLAQWKRVQTGDFIILDKCSINPQTSQGNLVLTSNGRPVFLGELNKGNLTILEFSEYYEAESVMNSKNIDDSEEHSSEDTDFEDQFDEDENDEDQTDFDFDEELEEEFDEFEEEYEGEKENVVEKERVQQETSTPSPSIQASSSSRSQEVSKDESSISSRHAAPQQLISPREIPVSLVIETGRIQMTVQKLLELEPGNMLELSIHPEDGVDLVVNSKKVGKGELIRIGENLGVRVLEIGTEA